MQAAIALICAEGVGRATFANIARLGGYSRGLVTHRFGSRQGLIESVIAHLRSRPEAVAVEKRVDELPGVEGLLVYFDIYVRHLGTNHEGQAYYRLLSSALADRSAELELFAVEHDRFKQRLAGLIARGQAEGDIAATIDPSAAAVMVGATIFGIAMSVLVHPSLEIDPICRSCEEGLRKALAPG